ncbi:hypothetical protein [Alloactinosynnema sp. L-07]|uniref:hypothetical protein n=1 Tax=Alloactinosynnema sp. L-07 TaxID=1653480 RepID=UPI00065F0B2A|nr:hypothetical protein [Alloactinosynnema sp. L-07]CRK58345.1 hypothetical protein [Alloactinosynnema sp. L-07]
MGGWAFLIGRGRHLGQRVLLAPDFLTDYGFLDDVAGPVPADEDYRTTQVGDYALIWFEHTVDADEAGGDPHDEHRRPLRFTAGMLYDGDPARPEDLAHARGAALDTYRHFLADEDGYRVRRSTEFGPRRARPAAEAPAEIEQPAAERSTLLIAGLIAVVLVIVAVIAFL